MTEYNAATSFDSQSHRFSQVHSRIPEAAHLRHAVQSSIESFQASLDAEHEVAIRVAPFASDFRLHAREVRFSPSNLVIFVGYAADGEAVHLVQHLSQVNFMLAAAKKLQEAPLRVTFLNAAA